MLANRIIPCLLMNDGALVKTIHFKNPTYIGDPINAVKIFNQKEVDELMILDISASNNGRGVDYKTLEKLVGECFMPICYGGGIKSLQDMRKIFNLGVEKISLGAAAFEDPELIKNAAAEFGSQAIVVALDVKRGLFGNYSVRINRGTIDTKISPIMAAKQMEELGAGEILLYSIDKDGTWEGYDLKISRSVSDSVVLPVIACGGAGSLDDIRNVVIDGGASAAAIGSMAVFQGKGLGVLIKFPSRTSQDSIFTKKVFNE